MKYIKPAWLFESTSEEEPNLFSVSNVENDYKSYTYVYFSWFIIPHLIWTSRGSYFPSPFLIMIGVLFYVTLRAVVVTWNKRKLKDAFFNKLIIF